ncbi:uncharacterized protein [Medicago truncatula]|uniref:uncharacterized protein n=1 Tax=Medicago truncatula TaxID=3880 RepID=UPI000D2F3D9D|nr:uncharacterized protein LOC25489002 [Medicago truncatula]
MVGYPSQTPPFNAYMPMGNENVLSCYAFASKQLVGECYFTKSTRIIRKWEECSIQFNGTLSVINHIYGSQAGGNTGSGSSGSKRSHESDACGSNFVGSSARPMGREAAKKKGKKKSRELERLDKIALMQLEANQLMKEMTHTKKMKMYIKISSKEHLDDQKKDMLEKLGQELFGN